MVSGLTRDLCNSEEFEDTGLPEVFESSEVWMLVEANETC
jgi:hypothetical protein